MRQIITKKKMIFLTPLIRSLFATALISMTIIPATSAVAAEPLNIASQGYFFVGGEYVKNNKAQQIRVNQMFVQFQVPANQTKPYPVVMWHGGGQTGTNFLGTPDGREGWATYFLRQGYAVYVVDQPARGRSGYFAEIYGNTRKPNTDAMSDRFTAPEAKNQYPQAKFHTQWPGAGIAGDKVFDEFFASQQEDIEDLFVIERLNRQAGEALLDKIGPAILLTHSQSGPFGWSIADSRPGLVKGILAIEPNGPPLYEMDLSTADGRFYKDGIAGRPWGIGRVPLKFDPPVKDPKELAMVRQAKADGSDLVRCWLQPEPARQLINLKGIPILIVASEASYHAPYDHCTSLFLLQAGVTNKFVRLPEIGIKGNGHMMMLEKNNLEIAKFLVNWATDNIR